jgi:hypothetical protein
MADGKIDLDCELARLCSAHDHFVTGELIDTDLEM